MSLAWGSSPFDPPASHRRCEYASGAHTRVARIPITKLPGSGCNEGTREAGNRLANFDTCHSTEESSMFKRILVCGVVAILGMLWIASPAGAANVLVVSDADGDALGDETVPGALAADALIIARLQSLGHTVTNIDDSLFGPADVSGKHLIVITATASSGGLNGNVNWNATANANWLGSSGIRNLPYPIINMENGVMDELGFVVPPNTFQGAYGTVSGKLTIVDAASPLAAGLSGDVTVFSGQNGTADQGFTGTGLLGKLPAGWSQVARDPAVFPAFDLSLIAFGPKGANLGPGTNAAGNVANAPANRVGFFLEKSAANYLTADGWQLFDAAVGAALVPEPSTWAMAASGLVALMACGVRRRRR